MTLAADDLDALMPPDVPTGASAPSGGDKRARILAAALALFAAKGFDGTAVPEIAQAASVATGTIYRYFETKDALLNALFRTWKGAFNARVLADVPAGLPVRDVFGLYWRRLADWTRDYPVQAAFLDHHFLKPHLDAESLALEDAYVQAAEAFVSEGIAQGVLRPMPPGLFVAIMWGASLGMTRMVADGHLTFDDAVVAQAEASLWDALKAP